MLINVKFNMLINYLFIYFRIYTERTDARNSSHLMLLLYKDIVRTGKHRSITQSLSDSKISVTVGRRNQRKQYIDKICDIVYYTWLLLKTFDFRYSFKTHLA